MRRALARIIHHDLERDGRARGGSRWRGGFSGLGCVVLLLLAGSAVAAPRVTHREGDYGGVVPGQAPEGKGRRSALGTLSWIGFVAQDGGAQVFLQSPGPFELDQRVEGGVLVVDVTLKRLGPNTWRQVDTRYFDTPLSELRAKAVGAARRNRSPVGVQVRVTFKDPKRARAAQVVMKTEPDGMFYAYLTFPRGAP